MILVKPVFENVRSKDGGSFACLEFRGPEFECPYHYHPEFEITWILSSEGQRMTGDSWNSFTAGDLAFLEADSPIFTATGTPATPTPVTSSFGRMSSVGIYGPCRSVLAFAG